jgi:hypothetical protein
LSALSSPLLLERARERRFKKPTIIGKHYRNAIDKLATFFY